MYIVKGYSESTERLGVTVYADVCETLDAAKRIMEKDYNIFLGTLKESERLTVKEMFSGETIFVAASNTFPYLHTRIDLHIEKVNEIYK